MISLDRRATPWHTDAVMTLHSTKPKTVHTETAEPQTRHLYSVPVRRIPRAAYVPAGRTLHLIDIENLMGGPDEGQPALRRAISDYREAMSVADGDHVVIGVNPALAVQAKAAWASARLAVRGGPNGADIALIESVQDVSFIAPRYDRIVVGSGDGAFEAVARAYRTCGLAVGVVSRRRSLSYSLWGSASFVRLLPDIETAEVVA